MIDFGVKESGDGFGEEEECIKKWCWIYELPSLRIKSEDFKLSTLYLHIFLAIVISDVHGTAISVSVS